MDARRYFSVLSECGKKGDVTNVTYRSNFHGIISINFSVPARQQKHHRSITITSNLLPFCLPTFFL